MNMKKILAILTLFLAMLSFVACQKQCQCTKIVEDVDIEKFIFDLELDGSICEDYTDLEEVETDSGVVKMSGLKCVEY